MLGYLLYGANEDNFETYTKLGEFDTLKDAISFLNDDLQGKHTNTAARWPGQADNAPWLFYDLMCLYIENDKTVEKQHIRLFS